MAGQENEIVGDINNAYQGYTLPNSISHNTWFFNPPNWQDYNFFEFEGFLYLAKIR